MRLLIGELTRSPERRHHRRKFQTGGDQDRADRDRGKRDRGKEEELNRFSAGRPYFSFKLLSADQRRPGVRRLAARI